MFLPELAQRTPVESLQLLVERCKKNPTVSNQFLVEDAVNRILNNGHSNSEAEKIITSAIKMLSTKTLKKTLARAMKQTVFGHSYTNTLTSAGDPILLTMRLDSYIAKFGLALSAAPPLTTLFLPCMLTQALPKSLVE
jgi:hypothetical protein